jgi:hypothetical protein
MLGAGSQVTPCLTGCMCGNFFQGLVDCFSDSLSPWRLGQTNACTRERRTKALVGQTLRNYLKVSEWRDAPVALPYWRRRRRGRPRKATRGWRARARACLPAGSRRYHLGEEGWARPAPTTARLGLRVFCKIVLQVVGDLGGGVGAAEVGCGEVVVQSGLDRVFQGGGFVVPT